MSSSDIHPPCESMMSINNHNLSVVSQVHISNIKRVSNRQKNSKGYFVFLRTLIIEGEEYFVPAPSTKTFTSTPRSLALS